MLPAANRAGLAKERPMIFGVSISASVAVGMVALLVSGCTTSGDAPKEELDPTLSYLKAEPSIGSIVARGNRIYIGFIGAPDERGAIVRGAALNAAEGAGSDAWVFATAFDDLATVGTSKEKTDCYSHAAINEEIRPNGSTIRHSFIKDGSC
jgi:hypothetical protein